MAYNYENRLNQVIEKHLQRVAFRLRDSNDALRELVEAFIAYPTDEIYSALRGKINDIQSVITNTATSAIMQSYFISERSTLRVLRVKVPDESPIDLKTIQTLMSQTTGRLNQVFNRTLSDFTEYLELNKTVNILDEELSEEVARALIDHQNPRKAVKEVESLLLSRATISEQSVYGSRISKMLKRSRSGRLIQLVDKNGKLRHYRPEYYAKLVVRTRSAQAQVAGALTTGESFGVEYWRVTKHMSKNTKICDVCWPFDGVVLAKNDKRFLPLTSTNIPTYHPQCRHRLIPITRRVALKLLAGGQARKTELQLKGAA